MPSPAPETLASENEEARQLYTAGRYYATRRTAEGMRQAIERLKRAVELDPEFALALCRTGRLLCAAELVRRTAAAGRLGTREAVCAERSRG